jgi:thiol-disulfide isomerase/thioredoxin
MKKSVGVCLSVVVLLTVAVMLGAAERDASNPPSGRLGQPAAPLAGLEWIKDGPVQIEKGSVYVVEFWATWCPPCRTSIPHLTELQRQFKDQGVTIIGISNETADIVKPFVEEMGEKMDYVVAVDSGRQAWNDYMDAFGVRGIPHAFIIGKDGRLIWRGHPMAGMDAVLQDVVAGDFDPVAFAARQAARQELEARLAESYKKYFSLTASNAEEARTIGRTFVADAPEPGMLNAFAWSILTRVAPENRDLELARQAAAKAVEMTDQKNPSILDTYALAMYELGKQYVAQAVTLQKKAVDLTDNEQARESLQKALQRYESATIE